MVDVVIGREAQKALAKLPRKMAERLIARIEDVAAAPTKLRADVIKLRGREGYRLRVGGWRVLFEFRGDALFVLKIGPRGGIYR